MLYGLKNDGGIELHLSKDERKLFYRALSNFCLENCESCELEEMHVDNILRIMHLPESVEEIEELKTDLEKVRKERSALLYEIQRLKREKESACKMAEDYYSDLQELRGVVNE